MVNRSNRINDEIRAKEVRLIDAEGEQLGIVSLKSALEQAEESELDLVEISPNAEPPVCRIMNYGKFLYEKSKSLKEQKKKRNQSGKNTGAIEIHKSDAPHLSYQHIAK